MLLLNEKNDQGAFLIRENQESLVLSILVEIDDTKMIRHYRILESDDFFFIGSHKKFKSLDQLIEFYSSKSIFFLIQTLTSREIQSFTN